MVPEMHLPGHSFTGPFTRLDLRLDKNDNPKPWSKPINQVDSQALIHDIAYRDHEDLPSRHNADRNMIEGIKNMKNPSFRERMEGNLVSKILTRKIKLGMGKKKRGAGIRRVK